MGSFIIMSFMEKELMSGKMDVHIRDNGIMEKCMDMQSFTGLMGLFMRDNIEMIKGMEKG